MELSMNLLYRVLLGAALATTLSAPALAKKHSKPAAAATDSSQPAPAPNAAAATNPTPATPASQTGPHPDVAKPGALNLPTPPAPEFNAKSYVLMDFVSGQLLVSSNPDERVEPASITKIMTSYVVSAELAAGKVKMEDDVFISENAWRGGGAGTDGSTSFLVLNSKVKLKDLLYGMIIQSGNDAAIALAEHIAGSETTFAELMNQYAAKLGMTNSHFVDVSGLPNADHYTTAHDIALLSRALIRDYPQDYAIYSIKEFEWNGIRQHNRNTLLWRDASVDGIKTGHTKSAGFCLAASAKRGDQRLISVIMGDSGEKQRADDSQALLNYGFRFFESHKLYEGNKPLVTPVLWKGEFDALPLGIAEDLLVTLPRGRYGDLKASMDLPNHLIAPFTKGQQVGTLKLVLDGKPLLERPLITLNAAASGGYWHGFTDGMGLWWKGDKPDVVVKPPESRLPDNR